MSLPLQTSGRCCSDLRLDQLLVGELDDDEARALRTHLEGSPRCRERLAILEQDRAAFAAAPPPLRLGGPHDASPDSATGPVVNAPPAATTTTTAGETADTKHPDRRWLTMAPLLAMAAGVLLTIQLQQAPDGDRNRVDVDDDRVDVVRAKGDAPRVQLHRQRGDAIVRLGRGDAVGAGDVIRVDVTTTGPRFVGVVGIDHDGAAAWIPVAGETIPIDGDATLPTAVVLDEAPPAAVPRDVLVVVYACAAPVPMATLVAATTTTATTAPAGCALDVLRLERHE